jgi:type II secretory pathway pseudopilin PulG
MSRLLRRLRFHAREERGSMLIELVFALLVLSIAVGAFMSLYAASAVSLRHTSIEGNALTLVDRQMEAYKALTFDDLRLSSATMPVSTDTYYTSPPGSVGTSFTNLGGGTATTSDCASTVDANPECAVQWMTGPDGRTYRLDSYIRTFSASGTRPGRLIAVAARLVEGGVAGPIRAQVSSAFDPANPPA